MKFSTLQRKARAAIKTRPEFRQLEREKTSIAKGLAAGKFSVPQAKGLLRCQRVMKHLLVLQELYKLMRADAAD